MSFSLKDFCVEMKSEINTRAVCIYYSCVYWLYIFLHRTWIVAHCSCWLKSLNLKFNKSVAPHVSCNANDTVNSKSIQRLLFELDLLPKGNPVRILSAGVMCTHEIWTEWKEKRAAAQHLVSLASCPSWAVRTEPRVGRRNGRAPPVSFPPGLAVLLGPWRVFTRTRWFLLIWFLSTAQCQEGKKSKGGPWFVLSVWHPRWRKKCRKPVRSCVTSLQLWIFTLSRHSPPLCYS